jgi:hypothetical protein
MKSFMSFMKARSFKAATNTWVARRHKRPAGAVWSNWWASPLEKFLFCALLLPGLLHVVAPDEYRVPTWLSVWLGTEALWLVYVRAVCVPRLASFHPEDAATPCTADEFDRAIDNVCFLLERDAPSLWLRVTGVSFEATPPPSVMRSYVRSLLFMFEDNAEQAAMLEQGVARLAEASAACASSCASSCASGSPAKMAAAELACDDVPEHLAPNLIRGWSDDAHLASIISPTPLVLSVAMELFYRLTVCALLLLGWRRGPPHAASGLECFVYRPHPARSAGCGGRPLVMLPGAGAGLVSFLPLALHLQRRLLSRTLVIYRLPHVEIARPW